MLYFQTWCFIALVTYNLPIPFRISSGNASAKSQTKPCACVIGGGGVGWWWWGGGGCGGVGVGVCGRGCGGGDGDVGVGGINQIKPTLINILNSTIGPKFGTNPPLYRSVVLGWEMNYHQYCLLYLSMAYCTTVVFTLVTHRTYNSLLIWLL